MGGVYEPARWDRDDSPARPSASPEPGGHSDGGVSIYAEAAP